MVVVDNFKMIDVQFSQEQLEEMTSFLDQLEKDFSNMGPVYADRMLFHTSTDNTVGRELKMTFQIQIHKLVFYLLQA